VVLSPPVSFVLILFFTTSYTTLSNFFPASMHFWSLCLCPSHSNIILIESMNDVGFAICFPAMSNAAPCTGSNKPKSSPIFAAGAMPNPPIT